MADLPPPPTTARWHTSKASAGGACVEVARTYEYVWVRDSKNRNEAMLGFTRPEWVAFITGVHAGEFDSPDAPA